MYAPLGSRLNSSCAHLFYLDFTLPKTWNLAETSIKAAWCDVQQQWRISWMVKAASLMNRASTVHLPESPTRSATERYPGDEPTKQRLEKKTKRKLRLPHFFPAKRPRLERPEASRATPKRERAKDDALGFLKSSPQIGELQKATAKGKPAKKELARNVAGEEAADFLDEDRFKGEPAAWQQREAVDAFLKRAPVMDPDTARLGPWLWVGNPRLKRSQSKHEAKADIEAFTDGGHQLLEVFSAQRTKMEESMPDFAPATITRKLRPNKEQLENGLLALAVETSTTCGKWMLFPSDEDYPRCWRLVAEATAEGKLGITSKAATPSPTEPLNLICVYTYDFTDMDDVRRVLEGLVDLGLCRKGGKPLFYKCDGYTYLGIKSGNEYKLRASLYSSKDLLAEDAKVKKDGPIVRVEKKNQTMDNFFEF